MGIHTNTKPITSNMSAPAKKASKPKAPAAHPKYSVMIAAAITSLKDRTGSSRQAVLFLILQPLRGSPHHNTLHSLPAFAGALTGESLRILISRFGKGGRRKRRAFSPDNPTRQDCC